MGASGLRAELAAARGRAWAMDLRDGRARAGLAAIRLATEAGASEQDVLAALAGGAAMDCRVDPRIKSGGVNDETATVAARNGEPVIVPGGRGGKATAIVSVRGIALYSVEFQPFAFSTARLASTVARLAADEGIGTIVLDVDSPGGVVTGVPEAAAAVFAARETTRVAALVNPLAASAAYWIAAQAGEVVAAPSADVGSIGVFWLHFDFSQALAMEGVTPTFVFAGEFKVEGNPFEPLAETARESMQAEVDAIYRGFVADVARGRGVTAAEVEARFGQGRTMLSPAAKRAGLIDRVMTPAAALARLGVTQAGEAAGLPRALRALARDDETGEDEKGWTPIVFRRAEDGSLEVVGAWPKRTRVSRQALENDGIEIPDDSGYVRFVKFEATNGTAVYRIDVEHGDELWLSLSHARGSAARYSAEPGMPEQVLAVGEKGPELFVSARPGQVLADANEDDQESAAPELAKSAVRLQDYVSVGDKDDRAGGEGFTLIWASGGDRAGEALVDAETGVPRPQERARDDAGEVEARRRRLRLAAAR